MHKGVCTGCLTRQSRRHKVRENETPSKRPCTAVRAHSSFTNPSQRGRTTRNLNDGSPTSMHAATLPQTFQNDAVMQDAFYPAFEQTWSDEATLCLLRCMMEKKQNDLTMPRQAPTVGENTWVRPVAGFVSAEFAARFSPEDIIRRICVLHGSRETEAHGDKAKTYDHPSICGRDPLSFRSTISQSRT